MAEIASHHGLGGMGPKRDQQVAGTTAEIESARVRPLKNVAHAFHRLRAPPAVQVERQDMIGEIVARRYAPEHGAHPSRRFLLGGDARGRCAFHARAERMAASTAPSSTPDTIATSPMRRGNTKCTWPWMVFLSLTRRAAMRSAGMPRNEGMGP